MHTLGKVFLWINLLLLVPAAVLLSAKLINSRNYWMQQVSNKEQQIESSSATLAEKEKQLDQLRADLTRERLAWDSMFAAPNSRADAQGVATIGIGPDQGFAVVADDAPSPIVHVFVPADQTGQASKYLGPFRIVSARGSQSQLEPMFRVVGNPQQDWPPGNWRVWQVVPSQAPSRVVALTSEIVKNLEAVASRESTLADLQNTVQKAQDLLDSRLRELLGNPDAAEVEGIPEISAGLVAALHDAQAARNAELARLDNLRRDVDQAYQQLTELVAGNEQLLGTPAGSETAGSGPALSSSR